VRTEELIQSLSSGAVAVGRLPPPWRRAAVWLAVSLPYVALVIFAMPADFDLAEAVVDRRFQIEQAAALATALAAAYAAFASVVPGYDRRLLLLPLTPLALWLATLGEGCVQDWLVRGADGLALRPDWDCLPPAALVGIIPAIAMVAMLRRGAPLYPRASLVLGALAVAALGNFGMRLFHLGDARSRPFERMSGAASGAAMKRVSARAPSASRAPAKTAPAKTVTCCTSAGSGPT
jgi:hypothetical protein